LARRSIITLAALLCTATVAGTPGAAAAAGNCVAASGWPADRADLAAQVVTLVNAHRAQLGLVALVVSPTLTATAEWKARNMAAYGYLNHDDPAPDARTADERLAACGYQSTEWGENIASGFATAQAVVDAWLASPDHRANIERPEFRATGVGAAGSPTYWAQSFGATVDAGSVVPVPVVWPKLAAITPAVSVTLCALVIEIAPRRVVPPTAPVNRMSPPVPPFSVRFSTPAVVPFSVPLNVMLLPAALPLVVSIVTGPASFAFEV